MQVSTFCDKLFAFLFANFDLLLFALLLELILPELALVLVVQASGFPVIAHGLVDVSMLGAEKLYSGRRRRQRPLQPWNTLQAISEYTHIVPNAALVLVSEYRELN